MKCVYCHKKNADKAQGVYPFCSERCKLLDLGQWTEESYRIPSATPPDEMEVSEEDLDEMLSKAIH